MGTYINTGNAGFKSARNDEYVDKSEIISVIHQTLLTEKRFSCVSRCRRFGKSLTAKMLCAYYDKSCDSRALFADLKIVHDTAFDKHLNKYPVISLDQSYFVARYKNNNIVSLIEDRLKHDIALAYPDIPVGNDDELTVANDADAAHDVNTSILNYNDENSLSCVLNLAFYHAKNDYTFHRELPSDKGFADLVLMPRKMSDKPAILIKLKKDQSAQTAIQQIHNKEYKGKVTQFDGNVILAGINYDSKTKKHDCKIEKSLHHNFKPIRLWQYT